MIILRTINVVVMIIFPVVTAAFFINRYKSYWRFWLIGGAIFLISQLGHIPFNYFASKILNNTSLVLWDKNQQILFNAGFLGLSAGIWEETSRYLGYRIWLKKPKAWRDGLILGLGHGSFEAILIGFIALYVLLQMVAFKDTDLSFLIPVDRIDFTYKSIQAYWNVNWYDSLLGALERVLTIPIQVLLSILIIQIFKRGNMIWLFVAIIIHTIIDASVVILINYSSIYITEAIIALFSLLSLILIVLLNKKVVENDIIFNETIIATDKPEKQLILDDSILDIDDTKYM